ncbi:MAG: YlmH/Sll1252 family protein [Ruminococcus sp.]|nr:YlmH/Sll1252 family protein [Ruminococcus sp.]
MRDKNGFIAAKRLDGEDKLLIARAADMLDICSRRHTPRFSAFLSEGQFALALEFLEFCGEENFMFYGGYEGAARVVLGIFPSYEEPSEKLFPVRSVKISGKYCGSLSHRDYLGSLISLGIERDQTGDIVCGEDTFVFLTPPAAELAVSGISKIGRIGVKCSFADGEAVVREDRFSEICCTLPSLRLDCAVSAAARISREKAAVLIRSGAVSLRYRVCESASAAVAEGDVLSVRGFGRYIIFSTDGVTRKNRIRTVIGKYL